MVPRYIYRSMKGEKSHADKFDRRTVLKNSAMAVGGLTAASGTVNAGKPNNYARAGWGLVQKETCRKLHNKKARSFKVLEKRGTVGLPAGCSENSKEKRYRCYRVAFKGKRGNICTANLYRRENMKQFKEETRYNIKKVKSCGENCRVHFKLK